MKYVIEEFWLDHPPSGKDVSEIIEKNYLWNFELFELVTGFLTGNTHSIIKFRKKEEE